MNRPRYISIMLIIFLPFASLLSYGQSRSAIRIRFKRGESSTVVKGQLSSRKLKQVYIIGAQAGQKLHIQVKAHSSDGLDFVNISVYDPSNRAIADENNPETRLNLTGDYRIEITPPASFYNEKLKGYKELEFSLSVGID